MSILYFAKKWHRGFKLPNSIYRQYLNPEWFLQITLHLITLRSVPRKAAKEAASTKTGTTKSDTLAKGQGDATGPSARALVAKGGVPVLPAEGATTQQSTDGRQEAINEQLEEEVAQIEHVLRKALQTIAVKAKHAFALTSKEWIKHFDRLGSGGGRLRLQRYLHIYTTA